MLPCPHTTPLVDVTLVLLVIFIITAPLLNQAVPVDLPRVDATRMNEQTRPVQVALDVRNRIFVGGEEVGKAALAGRLKGSLAPGAPSLEMHLRADRRTHYEQIAEVMAIAQSVGIAKIAFVTEAARLSHTTRSSAGSPPWKFATPRSRYIRQRASPLF